MYLIQLLKDRVCALNLVAAAFLIVGSSAYSQQINPFTKFGGNWVGSGLIYLSNGTKEAVRCRAEFTPSDTFKIAGLRVNMRCAGDNFRFVLLSDLNYDNQSISGTWSENDRGVNGRIIGKFDGDNIVAVAESQTFNANLELISLGDKQQVRLQSPGSEISDVLIGLNRSSK